jgi:DNA-binding CsgD family transcriptional regulator
MKTVNAGNVLDVTKTERKRLLAAAENEPVNKKQKMLTRKEVAEILGVHPETIKRYGKRGIDRESREWARNKND